MLRHAPRKGSTTHKVPKHLGSSVLRNFLNCVLTEIYNVGNSIVVTREFTRDVLLHIIRLQKSKRIVKAWDDDGILRWRSTCLVRAATFSATLLQLIRFGPVKRALTVPDVVLIQILIEFAVARGQHPSARKPRSFMKMVIFPSGAGSHPDLVTPADRSRHQLWRARESNFFSFVVDPSRLRKRDRKGSGGYSDPIESLFSSHFA